MRKIKKKTISIENSEKLDLCVGGLLVIFGVCEFVISAMQPVIWGLEVCIMLVLIATTFLIVPEDNDEYSTKCRGLAGRFSWKTTLLMVCLMALWGLFLPIPTEVYWIIIGLSRISYSASYLYHERKGA